CGRDRCQKDRLGLGVTTQPSPEIGRRSSRRKMAIFARNFAAVDLLLRPPFLAIKDREEFTDREPEHRMFRFNILKSIFYINR
ncbi:Ribosomal RNA processing Brix domain protein, partial [Prunus dulcis]